MDNRKFQTAASASPPPAEAAPSTGYPTDGNPSLALPATVPGAAWFHQIGEELRNLLTQASIIPSAADLTQLHAAIKTLFSNATITSAGAAPTFTLTPSPAIAAYVAGQRYRINFHATGTTGSNTLNVSALGVKNLKQYDAFGAKVPAMVVSGQLTDVEYDGVDMVILDPLMVDFSRKPISANDYQLLPSGSIIQWGINAQNITAGIESAAVMFPITFPNAIFGIFICHIGAIETVNVIISNTTPHTTSKFHWKSNHTGSQSHFWFAIGR
ncbi:gp53-like domain-containing protein [Nitrosovibrio sp. Nv4]|uniref:gp53-like domain-containing protein n=1 Tax=Nitrosovibrio sp. Nv4 TaxID=1945880 RepID=UPI000BD4BF4D|nr:hypothetical protein [Nitrosovibrio sp. Nv4]SOD42341.1 hypothetical protein SAMN06298226_2680 [Nitrosovibrio sp. Nv4]